jgi:acetyltransferase-like isoleucine patch superfamily enzyme
MQRSRSFFRRVIDNLFAIFRRICDACLLGCVHMIARFSMPGQRWAGTLQRWALQGMGVHCRSSDVWIGPGVALDNPRRLHLGSRVAIGPGSRLTGYKADITIGDDFLGAPGLYINTGTHDLETLVPRYRPVVIGANVWCGTRVTICAGVEIGEGCTIGAGSLVLRNIAAHQIAVGSPCRAVRESKRPPGAWSNFRPGVEPASGR